MAISPQQTTGPIDPSEPYPISRRYAWIAFAMIFALMLSDYLSRQVINAVFPFLKADWSLTDTQLGVLVSVVALTIGVTAVPISIVADRIGRVRAVTVMALVWALATVACGLAESFTALLIARAVVGLGEAGYGSTGAAILTRAFPARLHATVMGSYLAASVVGSVLGIVLGGVISQKYGWHAAFIAMGGFGFVIAVLFPVLVKEPPPIESAETVRVPIARVLADLVATRTFILVALGNGLSVFMQSAYLAWMPSYLNRFYDMDPTKAAYVTGLLLMGMSVGMVAAGMVVDRLSRNNPVNRLRIITIYCLILGCSLIGGLSMEPGVAQFILISIGMFLSSSFLGPAMAVAGDVTPEANHATTFGVMSLVTMLLGAAPGPFVTGKLADLFGLDMALFIVPVGALLGAICYFLASRSYARDRQAVRNAGGATVCAAPCDA